MPCSGIRPEYLQWEGRKRLLEAELGSLQADIICLQEVDTSKWGEICAMPSLGGYTGVLQPSSGNSSSNQQGAGRCSGQGAGHYSNAILYRSVRYELAWLEHRTRAMLAEFRFVDSLGQAQVWVCVDSPCEVCMRLHTCVPIHAGMRVCACPCSMHALADACMHGWTYMPMRA